MSDSKVATARQALLEIVNARTTPAQFGDELLQWLYARSSQGMLQFDEQPAVGKALWTMNALSVSMMVAGTTHFLLGMGSEAQHLTEYARLVGFRTVETYASRMIAELKRMNRGRIPATAGAMTSCIERLEDRDQEAGGAGLFLALDEELGPAVVKEIEDGLRAFVRSHLEGVLSAFATLERPAPPIAEATAHDANGRPFFSTDYREYDTRARAWLDRAVRLSAEDYAEVARRFRKTVGSTVRRKAMQVWTDGPRVGRTEEEWKPEFRKTLRQCVEVEKAITALLAASALSPAVQQKALEAYRTATSVLRHLPELERLPGSAATIDSGLAPFESFIPRWDSEW